MKRVIAKSTTRAALEIYYHEPGKLLNWAEPRENVRYVRLRSGDNFPLAERIAAVSSETVLVFSDSLLLKAADVWHLMGLSERNAVVVLDSFQARRRPGELLWIFFWRKARLTLKNYLYPLGTMGNHAFALNKKLLSAEQGIALQSFQERKKYADFLRAIYPAKPEIMTGVSFATNAAEATTLLGTGAATVEAIRRWNAEKKFPYWFSGRFLIFHVAQLAAYYGALVAFISPKASLIVFLFAALITPAYFFARLPWRRPHHALAQLGARFLLYFLG